MVNKPLLFWKKEVIDTGIFGRRAALALDSFGNPHVAYFHVTEGPNFELRYASRMDGIWRSEKVSSSVGVQFGNQADIDIEVGRRPHILYNDNENLMYAGKPTLESKWSISSVDPGVVVGDFCITVDRSTGFDHIAYEDRPNGNMKYAHGFGGRWTKTIVDTGSVGSNCDITLYGKDPHISYVQGGWGGGVKHAYASDRKWRKEKVTSDNGGYTSIVVGSLGIPHISYYEHSFANLHYVSKVGGKWKNETVDVNGSSTSIDLFWDMPHISYYDVTQNKVKYARKLPIVSPGTSGWALDTVGAGGGFTLLKVGNTNVPHIVYAGGNVLRYAQVWPREEMPVWKVALYLRTADVKDAGTDDSVKVELNSKGTMWLDRAVDDRRRARSDWYILTPVLDVTRLDDISHLKIKKTGSDAWCVESLWLSVNGEKIFSKDYAAPGLWRGDGHGDSITLASSDLRNNVLWRSYLAPAPPSKIYGQELENWMESIIGHQIHGKGLHWRKNGSAIRITRKNKKTIRVRLQFYYDLNNWFDPDIDVDFDLVFLDGVGKISARFENVDMDVEWGFLEDLLSLGLTEWVEWIVEAVADKLIGAVLLMYSQVTFAPSDMNRVRIGVSVEPTTPPNLLITYTLPFSFPSPQTNGG